MKKIRNEKDATSQILHLKTLLSTAEHAPGSNSFEPATHAFHTLVTTPGLMDLGTPHANDELIDVLVTVARQFNPKTPAIGPVIMVFLPKNRFIHGECTLNGTPANFCWFEVERIGLLILHEARQMIMLRLTGFDKSEKMPPLAGGGVIGMA